MKTLTKILFATAVGLIAATGFAADEVEQWGVFELKLNGPTNGNPFTDVKFSARFREGGLISTVSGRSNLTVEANGFYDGDGIYRVRFMPEKIGVWGYETESSAPELNGRTGEFTVTKSSPQNHG